MEHLPKHIAIIPDGNRRWAKERNLPSLFGHKKGYERVKELVEFSREHGISLVTFWAFSTENWKRSNEEVEGILHILQEGLETLYKELHKEKTRFVHIGRKDRLGEKLLSLIETMEQETKEYTSFCLVLAIDYGGEDQMLRASELWAREGDTKKTLIDFLDTTLQDVPHPEIVIRTSGEVRTSGFMPIESAYAEWFFEKAYFPDFDVEALKRVLDEYKNRSRRFGA
jgi:undecaprenyl diphosphate synthase